MKNAFEIRGDIVVISINSPKYGTMETKIDLGDLDKVQQYEFTWCVNWNKALQSFYVYGNTPVSTGKRKSIKLHRYLMGEPINKLIDHINGNSLDNRRSCNLREATYLQNQQNRNGLDKKNKSGFRGVCWHSVLSKWRAYINKDYRQIHLGYFEDQYEAAKAAESARKKHMPFSSENKNMEVLQNGS